MINIKRVVGALEEFVDDRLFGMDESVYPCQLLEEWVCNDSDIPQTEVARLCNLEYRGYRLTIDKGILGFYTIEVKRSTDV